MKNANVFLAAAALALCVAVPPAQAQTSDQAKVDSSAESSVQGPTLLNLTKKGASVRTGNALCRDQSYYLYSGGNPDNYAGAADSAYLSPNLAAFIPPGGPLVSYDDPMQDGRFGDSFNLQNTRGVCYALIQYRTKWTVGGPTNDGLTFGHLGPGGAPFDVVGQVIDPGSITGVQSYALNSTGLNLLSAQTGFFLDKTPDQSILDLYLQDDIMIDFFRIYIWYGPNCARVGSC